MLFTIQGKTDIKHLLIVSGLLALVAGGVVWYLSKGGRANDFFVQFSERNQENKDIGFEIYRDEDRGFEIGYPRNWERMEETEVIDGYIFGIRSRENEYATIMVGTTYIVERPEGVGTLQDWVELKIQGPSYQELNLRKEFVMPYASISEKGVYSRVTKDVLNYRDDYIQDEYTFSNFLEDENDRRMWFLVISSSREMTDEKTVNEIGEIVNSFDVLSYEW